MKIVATYDFNGGKQAVTENYPIEYEEIKRVIRNIDAAKCLTKISKEKTMLGKILYSPMALNRLFKAEFAKENNGSWRNYKQACDYNIGDFDSETYVPSSSKGAYRDMDFVKKNKKLGIEVQFGKYAFMVYN
ncbi:MAG: restriction endonuclease, partial [Spirochaetota bacterium]